MNMAVLQLNFRFVYILKMETENESVKYKTFEIISTQRNLNSFSQTECKIYWKTNIETLKSKILLLLASFEAAYYEF